MIPVGNGYMVHMSKTITTKTIDHEKMFKFFPEEVKDGEDTLENGPSEADKMCLREFEEVSIRQDHYDLAQTAKTILEPLFHLKYISVNDLLINTSSGTEISKVKAILESSSDLVSGKYEGGFKLWECTFDLLSYLEENKERLCIGKDTTVLDLGCGHGLLGLYSLFKGAKHVVFQDYNEEVLNFLTIPNVLANFGDEGLSRAKFIGGSWRSMRDQVAKNQELLQHDWKFDVILSSETIYNTEYLQHFLDLVDTCLKPEGSLYLAAKTCYFGVGGGTKLFAGLVKGEKYKFAVDTVKVIKEGVQREILRVFRRPNMQES